MFLIQPRRKGALSENNLFSAARVPRPDLLRHSPRYQTFPALSWAYQSSVISTGAPFSVTVSRTTRASILLAIIFVLSATRLDGVSSRIEPREFIGTYSVPSATVSVECWALSWRGRKGNRWFHKSG